MKRIISILVIVFLISSCQKEKKITNKKLEPEVIKNHYKPIFLSFSPEMTKSEFEKEIREKTWDKTLELGKFIIELNSKKYKFEIQKGENSINLFYGESEILNREFLNLKKSKVIIENQKILMNSLIQLFRNKKEYIEYKMPKLKEDKKELYLFRNKERSVLLSFLNSGNIVRSTKEDFEYYKNLENKNDSDSFFVSAMQFKEKKQTEHYLNYMWISYYSNEEMDKLISSKKRILDKKSEEEKQKIKKLKMEEEMKNKKIIENQKLL
ncbi:hypothetical protein H9W90_10400 [Polaribacter pectinis]|uniref:Lipoprotein n=1 Tax=Polaribacter pectinis TaxID=2738844 RepID=A0A7G9L7K7_9FLAO|nr:hypothetical protein [Polaribacter pectinis]QNM84606.1 hypothetical protein H9W90_10400 [Polaribacter pectinis]